ncbi:MAG: hypothetical protein A2Z21_06935 [Candidatus Fraserbacteria bacterium RBG_16_55_9]|uniref:O-antigen ligase-related domain-containing protein n=1 Tax=Fraserbacteria sp. (strain RBG_16_55_9) TaxID=1817864 RepID=A0A1F5UPT6_FRAXR|nr:MAG: hypothetical protein A2Z21_06935 [Candidatus Fraserbacteria bacterium RBG_16_55_9]
MKPQQRIPTLPKFLQPLGWKPITTIVLSLVSIPLFWIFVHQQDINAQYVLVLSLGSALILLWALPNVHLGLAAVFLFTQPLILYIPNTEYGYTKAIFSLGFISFLAVAWVGEMARKGRANVQCTRLFWPVIFLLVAALLSLINSQNLLGDLQYILLFVYFMVLYLYFANVVEQPGEIRFLLGVLLVTACLASIYALLQFYGVLLGAPGYPKGNPGVIISSFGNKNYLGGFLAYLFVPGLFLFLSSKERWAKASMLGALGLIYVTLVAISSESAWLGVLLSMLFLFVGLWVTRSLELLRKNWGWLLGLAVLVVVLSLGFLIGTLWWVKGKSLTLTLLAQTAQIFSTLGWFAFLAVVGFPLVAGLIWLWQSPKRRWAWLGAAALVLVLAGFLLSPTGKGLYQGLARTVQKSADVRVEDWWIGYEMFKSQPLIGIGLGDYKREFLTYKAPFLQTERGQYYNEKVGYIQRAAQAHNEYIQILAEMGIIGLLATVFLIVMVFRSAWQRFTKSATPEGRWLVLALLAGVVAFMSDSFFSFPLHLPASVLALVFLLGVLQSRALGEDQGSPRVTLEAEGSWILASVVLIVAFMVSIFAYRDWQADIYLDQGQRLAKVGGDSPITKQQATEWLETSLGLDFAPGEVFYWLGLMNLEEGNYLKARELFERSLSRFPTEITYYQLARVNFQLEQLEEAKGPTGNAVASRRYHEDSRSYLAKLVAMEPEPATKMDALHLKALTLYDDGHLNEARSLLEDLRQRYPEEEDVAITLGQMYLKQGQTDKARQSFEQALRIINKKLAQLQKQLSPAVDVQVPIDDYYRWKSEQQNLEGLKARVEEILRRLPQ